MAYRIDREAVEGCDTHVNVRVKRGNRTVHPGRVGLDEFLVYFDEDSVARSLAVPIADEIQNALTEANP